MSSGGKSCPGTLFSVPVSNLVQMRSKMVELLKLNWFQMAAAAILDFVGYEFWLQKLSMDLILDVYVKFGENPFKNGKVIAV